MRMISVFAGLVLLLVLIVGVSVLAQDELPSASELRVGSWTSINPRGETICSNGTPFHFFVRPAEEESSNLLVYFQGGGACWFGEICSIQISPAYNPFVNASQNPTSAGIFDFENPENPFADFNVVFIPYCTGDVHIGDAVTTYEYEGTDEYEAGEVTIHHKGYVNATTVLNWTFENFTSPETVFVTGSSAGAIPSPFYTEFVAEAYPDARIEQLGDAAGGYRIPAAAPTILGAWGTMDILTDLYEGTAVEDMDFEKLYSVPATAFPDISFTQYNTAFDETQIFFLSLNGIVGADLPALLEANFTDINAETQNDNFDAFTAGGSVHTILGRPEFYSYAVNGERFVDWVQALVNGEDVESVVCEPCEEAEVVESE